MAYDSRHQGTAWLAAGPTAHGRARILDAINNAPGQRPEGRCLCSTRRSDDRLRKLRIALSRIDLTNDCRARMRPRGILIAA